MAEFRLHVWPGQWNLLSFDPICLASILYFQLVLPGNYSIVECVDPDASPSGQLPFLVHDKFSIASFPAIVRYIEGLQKTDKAFSNVSLDAFLTSGERAQRTAWTTHVIANLGDLVYHMLFSPSANWETMTHPALVSMLPIPQRYYMPSRIRNAYQPRLEMAGLWRAIQPKPNAKPMPFRKPARAEEDHKSSFAKAFESEKVMEKAQLTLDLYDRLLGNKKYVFSDRPSTVDILLAAHILLLLEPPCPDPRLKVLVEEKYSSLVDHAKHIRTRAFSCGLPPTHRGHMEDLRALIPSGTWFPKKTKENSQHPDKAQFDKLRWAFIGLSLGCIALYLTETRKVILSLA